MPPGGSVSVFHRRHVQDNASDPLGLRSFPCARLKAREEGLWQWQVEVHPQVSSAQPLQ